MLERVQLRRVKGWRMPPNTIGVARPSALGNPYVVGTEAEVHLNDVHGLGCIEVVEVTPDLAVALYRSLWEYRLFSPVMKGDLEDETWQRRHIDIMERARGKNVACYCALDAPCHGDVVLDLSNR